MKKYVKAILPESVGNLVTFHVQEFSVGAHGELMHYTDGKLRATVPPEGWDDYADGWPDCLPVINSMRPVKAATKRKKK